MSESNDPNEFINFITLRRSTRLWLCRKANEEGKSLAAYTGHYLNDKCEQDVNNDGPQHSENSDEFENLWFVQREARKVRLKRAAASYVSDPSDKAREKLEKMCRLSNKTLEEAIAEVATDPFSLALVNTRGASAEARCIGWLSETIGKAGGRIEVSTLRTLAEESNFSVAVLNRAKAKINATSDCQHIKSTRISTGWEWALEDEG